ncbi:MAG TPA: hypothetical protein VIJ25_04320, partial [Methylococcales bacterium]
SANAQRKTIKTAQNDPKLRLFRPKSTTYREFGVLDRFLGSDCKPEVELGQFLRTRSEKRSKRPKMTPNDVYYAPNPQHIGNLVC